jgi:hypothetical protein
MNKMETVQDRLLSHSAALRGIAESLRCRPAKDIEVQAAVGVADLAASDLAALAEVLGESER